MAKMKTRTNQPVVGNAGSDQQALLLPVDAPTEQELVGIDTSNAQNSITIGSGLTVKDNSISFNITYNYPHTIDLSKIGLNSSQSGGKAYYGYSPTGVGYCIVVNSDDDDYTTEEHTAGSTNTFRLSSSIPSAVKNQLKQQNMTMKPGGTKKHYVASQLVLINAQYLAQFNIYFQSTGDSIYGELNYIDAIPANSNIKFMATGFIPCAKE